MEYLYETHMHTSPASDCATGTPAQQVRAYKNRGYTGIIVTDHFVNGNSGCPTDLSWEEKMAFVTAGYHDAKAEGALCGLDVFLGWEYCLEGTEFLTYGLGLDFLLAHPHIAKMTVPAYSALVRKWGGYLAQAHPYRTSDWIKNPYPVEPSLLDGIEVYNASLSKGLNEKAAEFARLHHLPGQAGSDSHHESLKFASGIKLKQKAESIFDIVEAIKTEKVTLILPE